MTLDDFFARESVATLSAQNRTKVSDWIARGRSGSRVEIVSPVCPDYSYAPAEDGTWRHTFDTLSCGIGMVGRQLLDLAPRLHEFLRTEIGVEHFQHHIYVGDTEGFSAETLKRVRLPAEEFAERVRQSIECFRDAGGDFLVAHSMSSLSGGEPGWKASVRSARALAHAGQLPLLMDKDFIRALGRSERARYERLFVEERVDDTLLSLVVMRRAMEYVAIGRLIAAGFRNPLILGVGESGMAQCFALAADVPVLDLAIGSAMVT